ncbi:unnamed protein product, partial [Symbiodinium pilosum]
MDLIPELPSRATLATFILRSIPCLYFFKKWSKANSAVATAKAKAVEVSSKAKSAAKELWALGLLHMTSVCRMVMSKQRRLELQAVQPLSVPPAVPLAWQPAQSSGPRWELLRPCSPSASPSRSVQPSAAELDWPSAPPWVPQPARLAVALRATALMPSAA